VEESNVLLTKTASNALGVVVHGPRPWYIRLPHAQGIRTKGSELRTRSFSVRLSEGFAAVGRTDSRRG